MDPFTTLGLPRRYDIDFELLENRYRELQRALHPDRHAGASPSERRMNMLKAVEVNDAYRALKDELRRADALLASFGDEARVERVGEQAEDPEFLLEMLELREALGEAKEHNDARRVHELTAEVEQRQSAARRELIAAFDDLAQLPSPERIEFVRRTIGRLKYFRRFLDEAHAVEDGEIG
jgi:molecular chaperone HscB